MKKIFRLLATICLGLLVSPRVSAADVVVPPAAPFNQVDFYVRSFGAKGDGVNFDTEAIQAAIDAAHAANGGRVILNNGTFLTRTIYLKGNVTLYLEGDAVLLGSTKLSDYDKKTPAYKEYTYSHQTLIYAEKADNVSILGQGAIDLQGKSWPSQKKGGGSMEWGQSPFALRLTDCRNLTVRDVTIRNCPMAALRISGSNGVLIDSVKIDNRVRISCDGIEVLSSQQVRIANCRVDSWDDGICLKSSSYDQCRNITITNCTISSLCNPLKFGTESTGGFENITVSNCTIECRPGTEGLDGPDMARFMGGKLGGFSGMTLEIVDGGTMDGINISNIVMKKVRTAVFIHLGNRARLFYPEQPVPGIGIIRNIMISNIQAELTDGAIACSITGEPGHLIENVVLDNLRLRFPGGGTKEMAERTIPDLPKDYPESVMYGPLPAYGFYCRYANNLTFRNVILELAQPDSRPAMVCDTVSNLQLDGVTAAAPSANSPAVALHQVQNATIQRSVVRDQASVFLRLTGDASAGILLWNNDLRTVGTMFETANGASASAITSVGNLPVH